MSSVSRVAMRPARRQDVPDIVAMLADDALGRGCERIEDPLPPCKLVELLTHQTRADAQRFNVRLGFQPSHVGMTLRF
jgi:hypothetical protein